MKKIFLILWVLASLSGGVHGLPLAAASKLVDKESIPELSIVYSKVLSKNADGTRLLSWQELAQFHERLLARVGPDSPIIQKYATKFGKDPDEIGGELLAKDLYRALSAAIDSRNYRGLPVLKGDDLDYLIQVFKVDLNPNALDGLIETMIVSRGATGSRDMAKLLKNLSRYHKELVPPRSLEDIFKKVGELDEDAIGVNYFIREDYITGANDLKPGKVYKGLLDILQNNKSPGALNGALYELDCAHHFSKLSGYKVLHIGRKFKVVDSYRLSDIDLVVKLPTGEIVFVQAKSTMKALQNKPEAFGKNFINQLGQLPTSGPNAAQNIPYGELFAKHVRISMPQGQYNPAHFTASVEKMVEGIAGQSKIPITDLRKQIRKQWGFDANNDAPLESFETVKLFLPIN